ncbi:acyl-CoA dehydrogenase family protein, partial [Phenylobacterium sp. Root1277]|uniref:acyl-CoA dehydrogenase family protein n=1 Tax=Phenylobacterium sp. Root1277 TaxID=1736442 RepID=UPI00351200EF
MITSFALTEPEAGSDSANVQTTAIRDGDVYVLNGTKRFITNANKADLFTVMARTDPSKAGGGGVSNKADLFTVMARTDPSKAGGGGVSAFLVERNLPGLSVGKPEKKMGQQGAHICDVIFDNVRVPVENRLGAEGEGFKVAMQVLDRGRLHISAVCIGVAERLLADCVAYATERKQFGQAISSFQLVQG